ncbi:IclR family transcriptional regulator [Homoserinibacter sp. GY 40078]|uniref:IclR family transcriptional regulator n=1 Tax=Homoserinibacter sp. GY 40078 TaxID=2603275 RepID=UPI0011CB6AB0|nr:IclR family transcriptional regulator [Homoserinibacter sp. GY 40078]TXK16377.1 IclR family transcriptional regulator [Homoserinibacter sp. GY 40078]
MAGVEASAPQPVKSADRALRVLEVIGQRGPMSFTALQHAMELPKSSAHSLVSTMTARGWLAVDRSTGNLKLGYRVRMLGVGGLDETEFTELADDVLASVRDALNETTHLAVLDGTELLYLSSKYSDHALGVRFHPGRRLPAYASSLGKAMLATLDQTQLDAHLPARLEPLTSHTITSRASLDRDLHLARDRGYAEDDEENTIGVHCFSVALSHTAIPLMAVSVAIPVPRLRDDSAQLVVPLLQDARDELLRRLDT